MYGVGRRFGECQTVCGYQSINSSLMHRRTFLTTIGLAAAGTQLGCTANPARAAIGRRRLKRVGIQLYSLRDDARRDLERTLADIAAIGYKDVEMLGSMNNFGMPVAQLRAVLDRNGLR